MALRKGVFVLRTFMKSVPNKCLNWRQMAPALFIGKSRLLVRGTVSSIFVVNALSFGMGTKSGESSAKENTVSQLLVEADRLYDEQRIDELYNMLWELRESDNADILWRLARAMCDKGKSVSDNKEKEAYFRDALKYASKALCLDKNNYACHKWYAFMLNYLTPFVGTKESLQNAYVIKDHLQEAVMLNHKDATSIHALGYWCYTFADLKWYERKLAAVLFATPPTSTFEEALKYFLKAEEMDPGFYSMNLLMIGKTYMNLQNVKMAYLYLGKAGTYTVKSEDDKAAVREATQLMGDLLRKSKDGKI